MEFLDEMAHPFFFLTPSGACSSVDVDVGSSVELSTAFWENFGQPILVGGWGLTTEPCFLQLHKPTLRNVIIFSRP